MLRDALRSRTEVKPRSAVRATLAERRLLPFGAHRILLLETVYYACRLRLVSAVTMGANAPLPPGSGYAQSVDARPLCNIAYVIRALMLEVV
jgi:hypothetical protein